MSEKTLDKHTHKLKRLRYKSGNTVFFCTLNCSYKIAVSLALGKRTICWRCDEPFMMNEYSIRLAKPHCEKCHKSKNEKLVFENGSTIEFSSSKEKDQYKGLDNSFIVIETPELSLSDRLSQTIQQKGKEKDEI